MPFDRDAFFAAIKPKPFGGKFTQQQIDGMNAILDAWDADYDGRDLRWLANAMAQTYHEVSGTMWPIEEYGKGSGQPYGVPDKQTGQTYYGRGLIQCTWRENYARADKELGLSGADSCEWHAENMLRPDIAAATLFEGMYEGWYRSSGGTPNNFEKYFNEKTNDVYNAREIINGDKTKIPTWSNGVSIGNLIKGYHENFLAALNASFIEEFEPDDEEEPIEITVAIDAPANVKVVLKLTGGCT